ncbi:hypothetical protein BDN70DRAFT_172793 [Pholiota conissans]|uniref:Uncharacterized protein n=1 Tax=Pholiota conissans TaxID=109636 RepID=A0A9P5YYM8_9AGAR|nr:hypothetical protein BDN70DRAFT_172793 [Pholiota conissans]
MVFHGPGIDGVDAAVTTQEHTPTLDEQEASLLNILDTTNSPEFSDNGPFYHLRQPFVDLLSAVRNLRDYRGAHPDEDAEMLNLDEAKESSYTRFGLTVKTVRWQDSHNKGVKEILTRSGMKERISSFWNIRRGLRSEDIIIYKHTASQNRGIPALARMIFFQLQFMYQEDLDLEPLVLTDMSFNIESDDPFTVFYTPDSGPSHVTLLRGSAKMTYVFFAQESGVNFRQGQSTEGQFSLSL